MVYSVEEECECIANYFKNYLHLLCNFTHVRGLKDESKEESIQKGQEERNRKMNSAALLIQLLLQRLRPTLSPISSNGCKFPTGVSP